MLTAVGAAGLGIGIGFGVVATDQWSEAERRCVPGAAGLECDAEGAEAASDADGSAWAATIGIIGGGAVATAGVGLLIGAALASDDGGATGALGSGSSPQLALSPEGARVGWRWSW